MSGKILKVSANDVYGKSDDRKTIVFSIFEHTKYMNNYVVFAFEGQYNKKKLCYGSIHIKNDSIVIFSVKDNIKQYIDEFLNEYENDKVENYKILDISKIEKVEIVSYSEMDYDKLELLDSKSIYREVVEEVIPEKKPIFLYLLVFIFVCLGCGLTLLYLKPDLFAIKYKQLVCTNNIYDYEMGLSYDIKKTIKFNKNNNVESIDVVRNYTFLDSSSYYYFKENEKHFNYFGNGEGYKYIDSGLKFKVFYKEESVIDDYEEMTGYLDREGFSCKISEYEK